MKSFKDLTGQKFGRLFVIGRANNKNGKTHWLCKCDCGNKVVVEGHNLKTFHTRISRGWEIEKALGLE